MSIAATKEAGIEAAVAYGSRFRDHARTVEEYASSGQAPADERWEALLHDVNELLTSVLGWLEGQKPVSKRSYERELLEESIREVLSNTQSRAALAPAEVVDLSSCLLEFAHALEHYAREHREAAE